MSELDITDGDLIHRKEIIDLLKRVSEQQWALSSISKSGKRLVTHELQLISINAKEGTFTVEGKSLKAALSPETMVTFRAQSGGISIMFQCRPSEHAVTHSVNSPSSLCEFALPYKITCTQLRKAARVNLEAIAKVPVVLYLTSGTTIDGQVMDVSTSGARFRIPGERAEELRNLQIVDACKLTLPGGEVITSGVQLVGMIDDKEENICFLRAQFMYMKSPEEEKLANYIDSVLAQL